MGRNRDKKKQPLQDKPFWCYRCDHQLVREGEVCKYCGHKERTRVKRFKKPGPLIEEELNNG